MANAREQAANNRQPDESIYASDDEWMRHYGSMQAIADEMQRPLDEIAELYEDVLRQLKARAQIPDYLPVLVSKKVKQLCRQH